MDSDPTKRMHVAGAKDANLDTVSLGDAKPNVPGAADADTVFLTESKPNAPGNSWIGGYRIVRQLGQGGMGVVCEAEQQTPRRVVALKVIRGGSLVDEQSVRLFRREAQALALLKHPGIAAIYEAGVTPEGQHFFAMELVRGQTLSDYAATRRRQAGAEVAIREFLRLFIKICEAVGYAHQRGVIHRDLKPLNILVTDSGGSSGELIPEIKILDFGLARITDVDVQATALHTEAGQIRGTLLYMSPEQARGNPDEIDVRSDIYSLGVVLYELISGVTPYSISNAGLHEAVRVITEQPPRSLKEVSTATAHIDRDVETIVLKCLEKEPARRYQSVSALAIDIERFLKSEPILARPPSTTYQLQKLIARHRLAFGFLAVVIVLMAAFGATMAIQARRLAVERDRAIAAERRAANEAETAKQVTEFLGSVFTVADPSESRGNTVTAREMLDRGAQRIRTELNGKPAVQAALLATVGRVYVHLGLHKQAQPLFEFALRERQRLFGPDSVEVAASENDLGELFYRTQEVERGIPLLRDAVRIRRKYLGDGLETAESLDWLGRLLGSINDLAGAEAAFREALRIRRRLLGPEHALVAASLSNLGEFLSWHPNDFTRGEPLLRKALQMRRKLLGEDHPETFDSVGSLANHLGRAGRRSEAISLLEQVLPMTRRVAPDSNTYMFQLYELGTMVPSSRDAVPRFEEALAVNERAMGDENRYHGWLLVALGIAQRDRGDERAAERTLRSAVAQFAEHPEWTWAKWEASHELASLLLRSRSTVEAEGVARRALAQDGGDNMVRAALLCDVGEAQAGQGRTAEGHESLQKGTDLAAQLLRSVTQPPQQLTWRIAPTKAVLGWCLVNLGRFAEAEPMLMASYAAATQGQANCCHAREAAEELVALYERWGKPQKAAEYRAGPH